jgi:RNA polymerase sigma factor for flagellar operon FliA
MNATTLSRSTFDTHAPMVQSMATRLFVFAPSDMRLADLTGAGWVGLVRALEAGTPLEPAAIEYRVASAMIDCMLAKRPEARMLRGLSRRIATVFHKAPEASTLREEQAASHLETDTGTYRAWLKDIDRAGLARLHVLDLDRDNCVTEALEPQLGVDEELALLASAIDQLPETQANILALMHQHGCTEAEIAELLAVPAITILEQRSEAMHRLRAAIGRT